ncbi:MAG: ribosomal protein S12 methylthiotransferase RimO [Planctomycetota bacterium]|nr:MAG: ribosomal protein S12 methylthiotransferase RimO [Planctomycetota bacterium]
MTLVSDPADARVVIVNTCGFIGEAREESVDTILEYVEHKRAGTIEGLVVTGCLVQLHEQELAKEIPEVDAFLGLSDYSGVPSIVNQVLGLEAGAACQGGTGEATARNHGLSGGGSKGGDADLGRALLTPRHTAYLRLGEGCNHVCAFCAIPKIRGKLQSKPMEVLVEEAAALAQLGTREISLVAEDSTDYGKDLARGYGLPELLRELGAIEGLDWIRVLYAHPATMDAKLATAMAETKSVLPYLDMPVQHGDADVLRRMRRGTSPERIREVVGWLRDAIPDLTLRTTILVGFPGETDQAFQNLMQLLEDCDFDRVGCFAFSPEEGTEGGTLSDRVDEALAEERRHIVMRWARERLQAANQARIGGVERVLVDSVEPLAGIGGLLAVARSRRDAPEIDGQVLVHASAESAMEAGQFADVKITGVKGYDVTAKEVV